MGYLNEKARACVELAESKLGDPYVFGAWGDRCTPQIRKQYAGYNPSYRTKIYDACPVLSDDVTDCSFCKWDGHLCYDCRGFTHYILKKAAGIDIQGGGCTSQYDRAANWYSKGNVEKMPNVVCCVFKYAGGRMSHTGLHIGDGIVIHCSTIVKRGALSDTTWTHYGIPAGLYTAEELKEAGAVKLKLTVKNGSSGSAVMELQTMLKKLGYDPGEVDGRFGPKTREAVLAFQSGYRLTMDGIVGQLTWNALEEALKESGNVEAPAEQAEEEKGTGNEEKTGNEEQTGNEEAPVSDGDKEQDAEREGIRMSREEVKRMLEELRVLVGYLTAVLEEDERDAGMDQ